MTLKQGDIIKTNFTPQSGHEQAGYRPAVVVSNESFNKHSAVTFVCPITHTNKPIPFRIIIDDNKDIDGFIMCDQLRSLDLNARGYKLVSKLSAKKLAEMQRMIQIIM